MSEAIKPIVHQGDQFELLITKIGKEDGQGVGYLDDGTMVVIEKGREYIGKTIVVEVMSLLQTSSGRIILRRRCLSVGFTVIIPAAGKGREWVRILTIFLTIKGETIIRRTVSVFENMKSCEQIFIAAHPEGLYNGKTFKRLSKSGWYYTRR